MNLTIDFSDPALVPHVLIVAGAVLESLIIISGLLFDAKEAARAFFVLLLVVVVAAVAWGLWPLVE